MQQISDTVFAKPSMHTVAVFGILTVWYLQTANSESEIKKMLGAKYYDGRKITLPVTDEAVLELYGYWLKQATTGFLSAFASQRIIETVTQQEQSERHQESELKNKLMKCAIKADTLKKQAHCILQVDNFQNQSPELKVAKKGTLEIQKTATKEEKRKKSWLTKLKKYGNRNNFKKQKQLEWNGGFLVRTDKIIGTRKKRERRHTTNVITRNNYALLDQIPNTMLGLISQVLKKTVMTLKHKNHSVPWYISVMKLEQLGQKIDAHAKQKAEAKKRVMEMLSRTNGSLAAAYRKSQKEKFVTDIELPTALQTLADSDAFEEKRRRVIGPMKLLREAIKIAMRLTNRNVSNFDNKTIRIVSPRILAVAPEENADDEEIRLFSPSLFSLHDRGTGIEKEFSIPNALKAVRAIKDREQEQLMDFILEASGANDIISKVLEKKEKEATETILNTRGMDGQPLYFTKENVTEIAGGAYLRNIELFEALHKTYTNEQLAEMNKTGFAQLTLSQLHMIYGVGSPYHDSQTLRRLTSIRNATELRDMLMHDIKLLSRADDLVLHREPFRKRIKRQIILSPLLLTPIILAPGTTSQPIILSPLVLSPVILSPAVFGPFILSPWVFVPAILSPRVLSPFIVSPLIFSPVILSPACLHPFILSPGIFNPVILSPIVLSPLILSPQAFSPFILSPLCLNPLILTPALLSPFVLSPFVLSPLVVSSQFFFALVLSPYAYSPLIQSKLIKSMVIASPSFMS